MSLWELNYSHFLVSPAALGSRGRRRHALRLRRQSNAQLTTPGKEENTSPYFFWLNSGFYSNACSQNGTQFPVYPDIFRAFRNVDERSLILGNAA